MHRGAQFVHGKVQTGPRAGQVRIDRVVWAGAADATVLECGAQPQLLAWAGQLLAARRVQQLINQVHFKLPGDGVEFPWHQDSSHRRYGTPEWRDVSGTGSYVQMVALVDDCTLANGPLLFVRGSCRHGHIEPLDDGTLPQEFIPREDVAAVTGEAGSVVLFGPYTIHGSSANRSDGPRRLLINGYAHPDANTRVYPGDGAGRFLDVP
jgi:ectoine hydroxylase-related dioxygenase (phytanoyl-CoA dioxygenase family)